MKGTDRPPNSNVYSSASHCHREGKSQGSLNSRSWGIASILKNKDISSLTPFEIAHSLGENIRETYSYLIYNKQLFFSLNKVTRENKKQTRRTNIHFPCWKTIFINFNYSYSLSLGYFSLNFFQI